MKDIVFDFKDIEHELGFVIRRNINTTTI